MTAFGVRALTAEEAELARETFGGAVRLAHVRILALPWLFNRAFVPGRWFGRDWILWPASSLPANFIHASVHLQGVLMHELTHVWQAQQGVNLLLEKLRAGDGPRAYAYAVEPGLRWEALNIEQQAMVVEHRFRLMHGRAAPGDAAFYRAICPFSCSPEGLRREA